MRPLIEKKNTGIEQLNKVYGKEFKYSANKKVYILDEKVIVEEYDFITIKTNISNRQQLVHFINEIKKTDLIKIFDSIKLEVDFKQFINSSDDSYITILYGEEFLEKEKIIRKEYYTVFIHTKKL